MAVFVVEFSHGLSLPFTKLLVGKRWRQPREGLGASREGAQSGLRTCSELGSERYKQHRVAMRELESGKQSRKASDTKSRSAAYGLPVPFMELSIGKLERNSREV